MCIIRNKVSDTKSKTSIIRVKWVSGAVFGANTVPNIFPHPFLSFLKVNSHFVWHTPSCSFSFESGPLVQLCFWTKLVAELWTIQMMILIAILLLQALNRYVPATFDVIKLDTSSLMGHGKWRQEYGFLPPTHSWSLSFLFFLFTL